MTSESLICRLFSKEELAKVNAAIAQNMNVPDVDTQVDDKLKDSIYGLLYDKYGRLWVKTSKVDTDENVYAFDIFKDGIFLKDIKLEMKKESALENLTFHNDMLMINDIDNSEIKMYEY